MSASLSPPPACVEVQLRRWQEQTSTQESPAQLAGGRFAWAHHVLECVNIVMGNRDLEKKISHRGHYDPTVLFLKNTH